MPAGHGVESGRLAVGRSLRKMAHGRVAAMIYACILAMIAGYADTIGYLHFNAFAGLMTGNTIFLGVEIATGQFSRALFHTGIIVSFLVGVIMSRGALRHGGTAPMLLTLTAVLLVVCSFTGKELGALLLALAMGVQNAAANRFDGVALNTVFITGNLQKLGEELVSLIWPPANPTKPGDGATIYALVWLSYAAGACLGAIADRFVTVPLLIPAVVLPFVMFRLRRAG
ncbi:YoaK family protein [Terrarubrum flagellatum]|uniref:YoaK family protein n=1 Tax=Terrirubrum flagellatum TaxID=2895980 RepID=UPI0031452BA8